MDGLAEILLKAASALGTVTSGIRAVAFKQAVLVWIKMGMITEYIASFEMKRYLTSMLYT